jgi:hypothetical protein
MSCLPNTPIAANILSDPGALVWPHHHIAKSLLSYCSCSGDRSGYDDDESTRDHSPGRF